MSQRYPSLPMTQESIFWIPVTNRLPAFGTPVLICYEKQDDSQRDVTIGTYEKLNDEQELWEVDGGLMCFGKALYWAHLPEGPRRPASPSASR